MNQLVQFNQLEDIALPDPAAVSPVAAVQNGLREAEINAGALIAWNGALDAQTQSDVSESLLFAQLAADATHTKTQMSRAWLYRALDVLEVLGWRIHQETSFGTRDIPRASKWRSTAQSAFERGYGAPHRQVGSLLTALASHGPGSDESRLWRGHSIAGGRGVFSLGVVEEDGSGDPILALMFATFRTDQPTTGILNWQTTGTWTDTFVVLRLDMECYDLLRDGVRARLGTRVNTDVIDIAL